ncbi:MAG TPA: response regulator [Candidatus Binatia bacterium]|nr:response regulator [Candidatus Binatia bacterium]
MSRDDGILLVEDDDDLREALAVYLESEGYEVLQARNGEEALAQLRTGGVVCLIVLDLFMPVMDGWRFRTEQLGDPALAAIPVLVLSADAAAPAKGAKLGAVASLVKPVDFDRLMQHVEHHC